MRRGIWVSVLFSCLPFASALSLDEVEAWKARHGEPEIRAALSEFDPNAAATVRLLDLCLGEFLSRHQTHLFNKWSEELETEHPRSALAARVQGWNRLMAGEPSSPTLTLFAAEHEALWRKLLRARPNDVSGVLSLRLLLARDPRDSERAELFTLIREKYSGTVLEQAVELEEGLSAMAASDGDRAADLLLHGLTGWPLDWERPEWSERLRALLAELVGEPLQAEIAADPSEDNLRALNEFRKGLRLERTEQRQEALTVLAKLQEQLRSDPVKYHKNLRVLVDPVLVRLRIALGNPSPEDRMVQAAQQASLEQLPALLVSAASPAPLAERLLTVAQTRSAQGETREALSVLQVLQTLTVKNDPVRATAWQESLSIYTRRWRALQALTGEITGERFEAELFEPIERPMRERARRDLERQIEQSSAFIRDASYSPEAHQLARAIYELHEHLGNREEAKNLLRHLAESATSAQRQELAKSAKQLSPEEAIAILQLSEGAEGGDSPGTPKGDREILELLEGKGDYAGAARVAHALALEASGTEEYPEAIFKAASLEFRAGDYPRAEATLSELLDAQDPKSPEYARTGNLLAKTKYNRGNYPEARRMFEQLSGNPNLTKTEREQLALLRVQTFLYARDYQGTLEEIEHLREAEPSRNLARQLDLLERRVRR